MLNAVMSVTAHNPIAQAMVSIKSLVPDDAMSAGLLGTERTGHGTRIREDGLIATIGYIVHEAETVWIGSSGGAMVPGFVVGYDFESGFGLVKPSMPLDGPVAPIGSAYALAVGNPVIVAGANRKDPAIEAKVVAKQEFAGRWEYLLDEAIFTSPAYDNWSGAALINQYGRLCGLGSLVIQGFETDSSVETVNMFVPIDLLLPIVDDLCQYGRRQTPPKPWLGMLVHEEPDDHLTIVGIYRDCPADRAGLKPGDIILSVNEQPVESLANMFREVWRIGQAGVDVPLGVLRDTKKLDKVVKSDDRASFQRIGTLQ
jgi:S1-C subfamily serine protease